MCRTRCATPAKPEDDRRYSPDTPAPFHFPDSTVCRPHSEEGLAIGQFTRIENRRQRKKKTEQGIPLFAAPFGPKRGWSVRHREFSLVEEQRAAAVTASASST
jgi:hypothetical protein